MAVLWMTSSYPVGANMADFIDVLGIEDDYVWNEVKSIEESRDGDGDERGIVRLSEHTVSDVEESPKSILESIVTKTSGTDNADNFIAFAGKVAQAESFRGKKEDNDDSSASGLFHILVDNAGEYNKKGDKVVGGGYDKEGNVATSSFNTAKTRLNTMIGMHPSGTFKFADKSLLEIMRADNPRELSREQQAILLYADLKMREGTDIEDLMKGTTDGSDMYRKFWVTETGKHSKAGIAQNWANAIIRDGKEGYGNLFREKTFFGLTKPGEGTVLRNRRGGVMHKDINSIRYKSRLI